MYYIYILRCTDGSLYIGQTSRLATRLNDHNSGRGAAFTFKRRPVELVYSEAHPTRLAAIRRERQLKCWTREKKEALYAGRSQVIRSPGFPGRDGLS